GYTIKNDAYYHFYRTHNQGENDKPIQCDEIEGKKAFEQLFEGFNFIGDDGSKNNIDQKTLFTIFNIWLFYNDHRTMRPIKSLQASPNSGKTTAEKLQKLIY